MKFLPSLRIRVALLAACAAFPLSLEARYENALPESTFALAQARDLTGKSSKSPAFIAEDLKKSGLEEALRLFFEKHKTEFGGFSSEDEKEFHRVIQFLEKRLKEGFFSGEATFALVEKKVEIKGAQPPIDLVIFVDTNSDEARLVELSRELTQKKSIDAIKQEKILGVNTYGDKEFLFAIVGKTFVGSTSKETLQQAIDAVKNNGRKDNFTNTLAWKRGAEAAKTADSFFVVNVPYISDLIRKELVKENSTKKDPDMFATDNVKIYDALAIDAIESFWLSFEGATDRVSIKGSVPFKKKAGLLSLLTAKPLDVFVPKFIPSNVDHFATSRFDFTQAWKNLELILAQAVPTFKPMIDMQLEQLKTTEGLDVRGAVLENFGEHVTVISVYPTKEQVTKAYSHSSENQRAANATILGFQGIYVLDVIDTAKLKSFIDTAVSKAGKEGAAGIFAERTFNGVNIRTFKDTLNNDDVAPLSYAINDGKLFVSFGADNLLNQVLLQNKLASSALEKTPLVRQALKYTPKNSCAISVGGIVPATKYTINILESFLLGQQEIKKDERHVKVVRSFFDILNQKFSPEKLNWGNVNFSEIRPNEFYFEQVFFNIDSK